MKNIILGIVLSIVVVGGIVGMGYNGFVNDTNQYEVTISAKYTDNQNVYDNGYKKVKEMAQVPQLQEQSLEELFKSAIEARQYDKGGELMKFIQEQNPNMDQTTFIKIQQAIEEYRNQFGRAQTELIAEKQAYTTFLTATTGGRFNNTLASMFSTRYPHIDMTKFDIVTSDRTEQVFKTHKDEPLDLTK